MHISKRAYTEEELNLLQSSKFSYWNLIKGFFLRCIFFSLPLILSLLLYEEYIMDIPSKIEGIILLVGESIIILYTFYHIYKIEYQLNKDIELDINNGVATIYTIKTKAVLVREEYEDLGLSYYIQLPNNKILYLANLYLSDFEIYTFPITEFEIVRAGIHRQILNIIPIGTYLKPLKILPALNAKEFQNHPFEDGDILDMNIYDIA